MPVIKRERGVMHNARWVHVEAFGREVLDMTWRRARWDRLRGRYFELHVCGRHVR